MSPRISMHSPLLNFFQNLFKISKLECVKSFFSHGIYKLFRGNVPGQKSVVTCSGRNFKGDQLSRGSCSGRNYSGISRGISCPGVVVQGGIIQGKRSRSKSPGGNVGNFMVVTVQGGTIQG